MTVADFKIIGVYRVEGLKTKDSGYQIMVVWEGTPCSLVGTNNRPSDDP
jgi:hypothetical protein